MTTTAPARRPRRDAQRNRAAILDAARAAFAEAGLEAPMDAIAKSAGIGAGTLYRHFPTRDDLVAAVLEDHRVDLDERARELAEQGLAPAESLERWLDSLEDWMTAYDGLPEPLRAAQSGTCSPLRSTCATAIDRTEDFLDAARRAGTVRDGVSAEDLFFAALGLAWAAEQSDGGHAATLRLLLREGWQKR